MIAASCILMALCFAFSVGMAVACLGRWRVDRDSHFQRRYRQEPAMFFLFTAIGSALLLAGMIEKL